MIVKKSLLKLKIKYLWSNFNKKSIEVDLEPKTNLRKQTYDYFTSLCDNCKIIQSLKFK